MEKVPSDVRALASPKKRPSPSDSLAPRCATSPKKSLAVESTDRTAREGSGGCPSWRAARIATAAASFPARVARLQHGRGLPQRRGPGAAARSRRGRGSPLSSLTEGSRGVAEQTTGAAARTFASRSGEQPYSLPSPRPATLSHAMRYLRIALSRSDVDPSAASVVAVLPAPPHSPPAEGPQEAASPSPCRMMACSTPWSQTSDQGTPSREARTEFLRGEPCGTAVGTGQPAPRRQPAAAAVAKRGHPLGSHRLQYV